MLRAARHRGRARGHSLAARRPRQRRLRFLAASIRSSTRSAATGSCRSGTCAITAIPTASTRSSRRLRRALRRLCARRRPLRRRARASRAAVLHADQRDHLLRLHGRRVGLGGAVRQDRETTAARFTLALARADIAAVKAIREDLPRRADGPHRPADLGRAAARPARPRRGRASRELRRRLSRLGRDLRPQASRSSAAAPEVLDIVGFNNYCFGQMEYREHGPHAAARARRRPHPAACAT